MAIRLPKSIFLHVPKCGGTWVRRVLSACHLVQDQLLKHATLDELRALPSGEWNRLPAFAFVRHPASWYRSYWAYKVSVGWDGSNGIDDLVKATQFEPFVRNCIRHLPGLAGKLYQTYSNGAVYVGRMELLRESLIHILTQLEEAFDPAVIYSIPAENVYGLTADLEPQCRYSAQLLAEVMEVEKEAIERYGYFTVNPPA